MTEPEFSLGGLQRKKGPLSGFPLAERDLRYLNTQVSGQRHLTGAESLLARLRSLYKQTQNLARRQVLARGSRHADALACAVFGLLLLCEDSCNAPEQEYPQKPLICFETPDANQEQHPSGAEVQSVRQPDPQGREGRAVLSALRPPCVPRSVPEVGRGKEARQAARFAARWPEDSPSPKFRAL